MINFIVIKGAVKQIMPQFVLNKWIKIKQKREYKVWKKNGCSVPPPKIVKQNVISQYRQIYGYTILVETGTYLGDMVEAQKLKFEKIISIELSQALFDKAVKRFKNDNNVLIVQGDSGKLLPKVLADIHNPAIFWLDGHYSDGVTAKGEKVSPIIEELKAIIDFSPMNHVILIDDARYFIGDNNYPDIEELITLIKNRNNKYVIEIKDDIIRCSIPLV